MRLFFSQKVELAEGAELIIPINSAEVGDVTTSELWINAVSGAYTVSIVTRTGEEEISLEKGIDMNAFALADTGAESRMLYVVSDASLIKITASSASELDVKVIY